MEQRVATQHPDVPVLRVEGVMGVRNREVGQSGNADGWRLIDGVVTGSSGGG
jgi:hypothetical protein